MALPFCPCDEDIAFIVEGLHEVTDLYHEMSGLLDALLALDGTPDLPPALRPIVERARDLAVTHRARRSGVARRA